MYGYPALYQTSATLLPVILVATVASLRRSDSRAAGDRGEDDGADRRSANPYSIDNLWNYVWLVVYLAAFVVGELVAVNVLSNGHATSTSRDFVVYADDMGVSLTSIAGVYGIVYGPDSTRSDLQKLLMSVAGLVCIAGIGILAVAVIL